MKRWLGLSIGDHDVLFESNKNGIHSLGAILNFRSNNGTDVIIECIEDVILEIIAGVIPIHDTWIDDPDFGFDGPNTVKVSSRLGCLRCWFRWSC